MPGYKLSVINLSQFIPWNIFLPHTAVVLKAYKGKCTMSD